MAEFTQQINNFEKNGTYNYILDEGGNEVLNPSSSIFQQNYLPFDTVIFSYDETKIATFYNVSFSEFLPTQTTSSVSIPQETIDKVNQLTYENQTLQSQLDSLVASNNFSSASADQQEIRDIILSLRVNLGQGTSSVDFENTFPYFPIALENKNL